MTKTPLTPPADVKVFIADFDKKVLREKGTQTFGRADYWNTESETEHNEAYEAHLKYQESLKQYPATWLTKEQDGKEFVDGVDFVLGKPEHNPEICGCENHEEFCPFNPNADLLYDEFRWKPLAVPLTPPADVSIEELAKEIEKVLWHPGGVNAGTLERATNAVVEYLVKAGYAAAKDGQAGWISVKDKLPEVDNKTGNSENVFAMVGDRLMVMAYCWIDCGEEGSGNVWCNCYGDINGDAEFDDNYTVTHWRPLPTPPINK